MKHLLYILAFSVIWNFSSCNAQESKKSTKAENDKKKENDDKKKPKVDIKVNKYYDDEGNLIGFDSTYTSFYSNIEGDTIMMDSLYENFGSFFEERYPDIYKQHFENMFLNDSLFYTDFFHDDFFKKRYELNQKYFDKMMSEMDSIKNEFYKEQSKLFKPKK